MGLENILERIRKEGEWQIAQITQQGEREASAILERTHQEADAVYQAARREVELPAEGECSKLQNEARFKASCILGQARENFINAVLQNLEQRLAHSRDRAEYAEALRGQLIEILPGENGFSPNKERIRIQADPCDRRLLESLLREEGVEVEVEYSLACWGGVNASTVDRGICWVNTLESRFDRATPYLRRQLAEMFEERTARISVDILTENHT